jgi:hypothetical protein
MHHDRIAFRNGGTTPFRKMLSSVFIAILVIFTPSIRHINGQLRKSAPQKNEDSLALAARAERVLDGAENLFQRSWRYTKTHRNFVKGLTGGLVLAYGKINRL